MSANLRLGGTVAVDKFQQAFYGLFLGNVLQHALLGTVDTFSANVGAFSDGTWTGNAASVTLTATGTGKINTITVTYTAAASYTITAVSNDEDMGTVSGTTTITATPKSGYRVKSGAEGYTVTSGTATVTNNEDNTFSVTASTDCTIRINFEAIPTHTLSSVADPVAGGTIDLGATSVREGSTTTIEAHANAGYKFTGWTITGTGATIDDDEAASTTITMGTADATVTASFEAVVTHEIKWSVNGVIVKTENIEENTAIDFAAPVSIPTGYSFVGWRASTLDVPQNTAPTYVTSATCTADAIYYAVLAKAPMTVKTYGFETSSDDDWTISGPAQSNESKNSGSYSGKINTANSYVTFKNKVNVTNFSFAFARKTNNNNYNVYIETSEDGSSWTAVSTYAMSSFDDNGAYSLKSKDFDGKKTLYVRFHCYNTTAVRYVDDVSITYKTLSGYCTTVPNEEVAVSAAGFATYVSDFDLDYTSVTGLKAYKAVVDDQGAITFTKVTTVPAGEGVLLQGDEDTYSVPVVASSVSAWADADNAFVRGTGAAVATGTGPYNYILNKKNGVVGFYQAAGQTVAKNRAYLQSVTNNARISLELNDEVVARIYDLVPAISKGGGSVYDLMGRKVMKPAKGLYIVNGKKVIVK
nr:hypothetical protein [Xylanibacter brevis]